MFSLASVLNFVSLLVRFFNPANYIRRSKASLHNKVVNPDTLEPAQQSILFNEIAELDRQIFEYVSPEIQQKEYESLHSDVRERRVVKYFSDETMVGFNILSFQTERIHGKEICVINANAGLLDAYTGGASTLMDAFKIVSRIKLKNWSKDFYLVTSICNPGVYRAFHDLYPQAYPRPDNVNNEGFLKELYMTISAQRFENKSQNEGVFITSYVRPKRLRPLKNLEAEQFFNRYNPGYQDGDAMVISIPITFSALLRAALTLLRKKMK